jgi:hypothetical protein
MPEIAAILSSLAATLAGWGGAVQIADVDWRAPRVDSAPAPAREVHNFETHPRWPPNMALQASEINLLIDKGEKQTDDTALRSYITCVDPSYLRHFTAGSDLVFDDCPGPVHLRRHYWNSERQFGSIRPRRHCKDHQKKRGGCGKWMIHG